MKKDIVVYDELFKSENKVLFDNCVECYENDVYTFVHFYNNCKKILKIDSNKQENIKESSYFFKRWLERNKILKKGEMK